MPRRLCLVFLGLFVGCAAPSHDTLYRAALADAFFAEPHELATDLWAIRPDNPALRWDNGKVLVATWTQFGDSYTQGALLETSWGDTWVTAVPELKQEMARRWDGEEPLSLRLEQLLGLPENSGKSWIIEAWVDPADLFRPSPDPEIDDSQTLLAFRADVAAAHRSWFEATVMANYFQPRKFPWTRMGYSYDWHPLAQGEPVPARGLSEFVLRKGAKVKVASKTDTESYLAR